MPDHERILYRYAGNRLKRFYVRDPIDPLEPTGPDEIMDMDDPTVTEDDGEGIAASRRSARHGVTEPELFESINPADDDEYEVAAIVGHCRKRDPGGCLCCYPSQLVILEKWLILF